MEIYVVDAFAEEPFTGNQAAVCVLDASADDAWLQSLAAEMNYSETAYLLATEGGEADYSLRWFTPAYEVDLCGHATLASAHVLWREKGSELRELKFETRSGILTATQRDETIVLDFPATPPEPCPEDSKLLAALGIDTGVAYVGRSTFDSLVVIENATTLRELKPDFRQLKAGDYRGYIVTAPSDDERFDFLSRFFAPGAGIDEDPVTGSAHCCLTPYWASRLSKNNMVGFQASSRGGIVSVELNAARVALGGNAVTVTRGKLSEQVVARARR